MVRETSDVKIRNVFRFDGGDTDPIARLLRRLHDTGRRLESLLRDRGPSENGDDVRGVFGGLQSDEHGANETRALSRRRSARHAHQSRHSAAAGKRFAIGRRRERATEFDSTCGAHVRARVARSGSNEYDYIYYHSLLLEKGNVNVCLFFV